MNIKVHSSELNRMMKTVSQCIDDRFDRFSNIEISHDSNYLKIRGTNGEFSAMVSTPLLGGDGEKFCVDGTMFARVCSMCNGEISIVTDGNTCTIKGAGRTRLPIINSEVPEYKSIPENNQTVLVKAEDFSRGYNGVAHAVSNDQGRVQLTGVLISVDETGLCMTSLDGFRMAVESLDCDGDPMRIDIPGTFMKLVQNSTVTGETIKLVTDGKKVEAITDGMKIVCGLLVGDYPDTKKIVPQAFATECLVNVNLVKNALKSSSVLNNKNNLVKITIGGNSITVMSNSEKADFQADIDCETNGNGLTIAFNQKYLLDTMNSIPTEEVVMKFNTLSSPCVVNGKDENGFRMILPVRTQGLQ